MLNQTGKNVPTLEYIGNGLCKHCNLLATMENGGAAGEVSQMSPELWEGWGHSPLSYWTPT